MKQILLLSRFSASKQFMSGVSVTVIEVLPKEKKQKEEKIVTLGQAILDLLPLLEGA